MGLLRDNEEVKTLVKIGFKEIEREMGELDQSQKTERNERTRENFELKKMISSSSEEKEEKLFKLEKDFNAKIYNMKDKLHSTFEEFQDKVTQQIEDKFAEKLPEVFDKLNDMSAKMSLGGYCDDFHQNKTFLFYLVFSDQREKVDAIEKKLDVYKEDISHLINKTNDDLNKAIESNMEDTTQAVVTLRKDFIEQVKTESEIRKEKEKEIRTNLADSVEKFSRQIEELEGKDRDITEETKTEFERLQSEITQSHTKIESNLSDIRENSNENIRLLNEQIKSLGIQKLFQLN